MRKYTKYFIAAIFIILLFFPAMGRIAGFEDELIENRRLAEFPDFAYQKLINAEYFEELSEYIRDHLPFRSVLIHWNSWIDFSVFHDSPNSKVIPGKNGWMFLKESLEINCRYDSSPEEVLTYMSVFAKIIKDSGKEFRFIICPNKSAIYPEYLSLLGKHLSRCSDRKRESLRRILNKNNISDFINLWEVFESEKANSKYMVYYPLDRHWTNYSAFLLTRAILTSLDRELWESEIHSTEPRVVTRIRGELPEAYFNLTILQDADFWNFKRKGITVERSKYQVSKKTKVLAQKTAAFSDGPRLINKKVLFIHDSFLVASIYNLSQYIEEINCLNWRHHFYDFDSVVDLIKDSDVIIVEIVEDRLYSPYSLDRLGNNVDFLKKLRKGLQYNNLQL